MMDTLGSAFPPQNLKITIENSLIRDALVVELDCFFEDPDLSILNLNTAFDLELTAISLDSDLVMMTDDYSFTDTRFQTKSGISTSSIRYFDELTLIPTLEPCVDCGCEADTNEC